MDESRNSASPASQVSLRWRIPSPAVSRRQPECSSRPEAAGATRLPQAAAGRLPSRELEPTRAKRLRSLPFRRFRYDLRVLAGYLCVLLLAFLLVLDYGFDAARGGREAARAVSEEPSIPAMAPFQQRPLLVAEGGEQDEAGREGTPAARAAPRPPATLLERIWRIIANPENEPLREWKRALGRTLPGLGVWMERNAAGAREPNDSWPARQTSGIGGRLPLIIAMFAPESRAFLSALPGLGARLGCGAGEETAGLGEPAASRPEHGPLTPIGTRDPGFWWREPADGRPATSPGAGREGPGQGAATKGSEGIKVFKEGDLSVYGVLPPAVGIYHTHSMESYLPEIKRRTGKPNLTFDDAHTSDLDITVVKLGQMLAETLAGKYGVAAVHSSAVHDRDGKQGAYTLSLATAKSILEKYPGVRVLLDIHRDAQPRDLTTAEIGGKEVARIMVVLGTSQNLPHPGWRKNYEFAMALARGMERKYAGLSLGVFASPNRYNQHLSPGALLLEVGGVENTLQECALSISMLADVLADLLERGEVPPPVARAP